MKKLFTICRYLFLVIFLAFSVSMTFFNHTHICYGNIIIHSHPFKHDDSGSQSHQHSWDEYLRINLLNHYSDDRLINPAIPFILMFAISTLTLADSDALPATFIHTCHLRGPPSLFLNPDVR